jgi:four helix bundle protein
MAPQADDHLDEFADDRGDPNAEGGEGNEGNQGNEGGNENRNDRGDQRDRGRGRDRNDRNDRREPREPREPRERIVNFEQMKVWQESHALTLKVFANTPKLPAEQQAGLAMQMEAAAINVPKSIAEGFRRRGPRNKAHYYNIAQSSLEGLRYYFILCRDLGYEIAYPELADRAEQVGRMLDGLIRSMLR